MDRVWAPLFSDEKAVPASPGPPWKGCGNPYVRPFEAPRPAGNRDGRCLRALSVIPPSASPLSSPPSRVLLIKTGSQARRRDIPDLFGPAGEPPRFVRRFPLAVPIVICSVNGRQRRFVLSGVKGSQTHSQSGPLQFVMQTYLARDLQSANTRGQVSASRDRNTEHPKDGPCSGGPGWPPAWLDPHLAAGGRR